MALKTHLKLNLARQVVLTPRTYHKLMRDVWDEGQAVSPRGLPTRELFGAQLYLRNPLDRIVPSPARKLNPGFMVAEWVSTVLGIDDINFFTQFISGYNQYSSDGKTLDGCYGTRINYTHPNGEVRNQLKAAVHRLQQDPDSRQAVVALYGRDDLFGGGGVNTPCTLNLQFMVRDDHLHLITTMRSNDVHRGLPYDMFNFTMLQELVAGWLGLPMGVYLHQAASLHMYEADLPVLEAMEDMGQWRWPHLMRPMPAPVTQRDLDLLGELATSLYDDRFYALAMGNGWSTAWAKDYLVSLAATMRCFVHRNDVDSVDCLQAFDLVGDTTLRYMLRWWLRDAGVRSARHWLTDDMALS